LDRRRDPILRAERLNKVYWMGTAVYAVDNVSLDIDEGHFELWAAGELLTASDCKRLSGSEVPGRVVLADSYVLPEVLPILARRGAVGLICGGLDFGPLWDLISPDGPHPAGQGLPSLVELGGFGVRRIDTGARGVLAGAQGRPVYLSGPAAGKLVFAGPPYAEVVVFDLTQKAGGFAVRGQADYSLGAAGLGGEGVERLHNRGAVVAWVAPDPGQKTEIL